MIDSCYFHCPSHSYCRFIIIFCSSWSKFEFDLLILFFFMIDVWFLFVLFFCKLVEKFNLKVMFKENILHYSLNYLIKLIIFKMFKLLFLVRNDFNTYFVVIFNKYFHNFKKIKMHYTYQRGDFFTLLKWTTVVAVL